VPNPGGGPPVLAIDSVSVISVILNNSPWAAEQKLIRCVVISAMEKCDEIETELLAASQLNRNRFLSMRLYAFDRGVMDAAKGR
jgi:hypothetical protein